MSKKKLKYKSGEAVEVDWAGEDNWTPAIIVGPAPKGEWLIVRAAFGCCTIAPCPTQHIRKLKIDALKNGL